MGEKIEFFPKRVVRKFVGLEKSEENQGQISDHALAGDRSYTYFFSKRPLGMHLYLCVTVCSMNAYIHVCIYVYVLVHNIVMHYRAYVIYISRYVKRKILLRARTSRV